MPEQTLRDPDQLSREARSNLRELAVALDRAGVQESFVTDVERLKEELGYLTEDLELNGVER